MYFDFLKDVINPVTNEPLSSDALHNYCASAEKDSRVNPNGAIINVRQAIEVFVAELLSLHDIEKLLLSEKIEKLASLNIINESQRKQLRQLNHDANDYIHIKAHEENKKKYVVIKNIRVMEACYHVVKLYDFLRGFFNADVKSIDRLDLPIGKYTVVERVEKDSDESIIGNYNFKCVTGEMPPVYAFIRPFRNSSNDKKQAFSERDKLVQRFNKSINQSKHITAAEEIEISNNCDVSYLVYNITKNTKQLFDIEKDELSPNEILQVALQITEGLLDLNNDDFNIHHRSIKPKYIFINKDRGISAKLAFFESAKVTYQENSIETVMPHLQRNIYSHPQFSSDIKDDSIWERNDVYSLAKIVCFCIDPLSTQLGYDVLDELYDYYSDEFVDEMSNILNGDITSIPSLNQFYDILKKELQG